MTRQRLVVLLLFTLAFTTMAYGVLRKFFEPQTHRGASFRNSRHDLIHLERSPAQPAVTGEDQTHQPQGDEPNAVHIVKQQGLDQSIVIDAVFPRPSVLKVNADRSHVFMQGAQTLRRAGKPLLPVVPCVVELPPGRTVAGIEIIHREMVELPGRHRVAWSAPMAPFSCRGEARPAGPDPIIYDSDDPYPRAAYTWVGGLQRKREGNRAHLRLHPVVYRPATMRVSRVSRMKIRIATRPADAPDSAVASRSLPPDLAQLPEPSRVIEYLVVTNQAARDTTATPTVRDLVAHRQSQGLQAEVLLIEDLVSSFDGRDDPERLRAALRYAYENWGTRYVVLAGDTNIIPCRYFWCEYAWGANYFAESFPSDFYYQCLDGDFNSDNDNKWGEATDGPGGSDVDLSPELMLGRLPAENAEELSHQIEKILRYEKEAAAPYHGRHLFVAEFMGWGGDISYSDPFMEEIRQGTNAHGYTTTGFASVDSFTTETRYASTYGKREFILPDNPLDVALRSGAYSTVNHLGHGADYKVMGYYTQWGTLLADGLTNPNPFFLYSAACHPGNFAEDCVAEHMLTSHRHGAFAAVLNTSWGWGNLNEDRNTDHAGQRLQRLFWDTLLTKSITSLGAAHAASREACLWNVDSPPMRWSFYSATYFGDPLTPLRGMDVNRPPTVVAPISDIVARSDAPSVSIDLSTTFSDPDIPEGDALTYTISTNTPIEPIVARISQGSLRSIHEQRLYTHLGDSRLSGDQHDQARDNIQEYFQALGLRSELEFFSLLDTNDSANVVAVKTGAVRPDEIYILGAHYDSVGGPGADDNASGVAAVMEAARVLSDCVFEATVTFIAFDREEWGLKGSLAYAQRHASDDIRAMVNLDTIGFNPDGPGKNLVRVCDSSATDEPLIKSRLIDAFNRFNLGRGLSAIDGGLVQSSDHTPFAAFGLGSALLIEHQFNANPYIHTHEDAVETDGLLDYAYATGVTCGAAGCLIRELGLTHDNIPFTLTLDDGRLTLDFIDGRTGVADVTVRATDSSGEFAEDSFKVTVTNSDSTSPLLVTRKVSLRGQVMGLTPPITLLVDEEVILLGADGSWTTTINVPATSRSVVLDATDAEGRRVVRRVRIACETP